MKLLRLLRRQLNYQLSLIYADRSAEAVAFGSNIENTISRLAQEPPQGDRAAIEQNLARCHELNEMVLNHLEAEKKVISQELFQVGLEKSIQSFLKQ